LPDLRLLRQWQVEDEPWIFFDRQLRHYACGDSRGNFRLCRVADDRETVRLPGPGHPGWVAQFSPDGRFFAARHHPLNGDTAQIHLWDLSDSAAIRRGPLLLAAKTWDFSPDNRLLAASRDDGRIVLYHLPSGQLWKELAQGRTVRSLAFHPTGRKLAVASREPPEVRVYAVPDGQELQRLPHPTGMWNLTWSEDGQRLAAACGDGKVYVWGPRENRPPLVLDGHKWAAVFVAFNHAGDLLASAGWDSTLRLWRVDTGQQLLSLAGDVRQPRFSTDDRWLGWFPEQGKVGVYEMVPARECRLLGGQAEEEIRRMDFSPDGRLLAAAGRRGVALWDALHGQLLAQLPPQETAGALFAADGKGLLTSGRTGLWHWPIVAEEAGPRLAIGPPRLRRRGPATEGLAQSADGRTLAVNLHGERAVVLRDENEIALGCLEGRDFIQLSPDGRWAASDVWHGKETKIWNARTGQVVHSLPNGDTRVVFSPDGRWLAVGRKGEYQLLEVGTWQPSGPRWARRSDLPPGFLAFRPDSQVVALTPSDRAIRLVDCATGRELATLTSPGHRPYTQLCFSRDGNRLAALCGLNSVQIWDLSLIHRGLAERNLHDDFPWAAAPEPPPRSPARLQVRLDLLSP
ncbi:MAG TPA: WD40 repeat domain-containing protein, partial [Gemmataceae bacterium]